MRLKFIHIISALQIALSLPVYGQTDQDPPVSPVLNLVTVNQETGNSELSWSLSPSSDVSGYVVYSFINGEGYALDTLFNPNITTYIRYGSGSSYFSESFVVAALDSSGNISPLSNALHTIFINAEIDTCGKKIDITWNSYSSFPRVVLSYTILFSTNGTNFTEAGEVSSEKKNLTLEDFTIDVQYCFIVRANLAGGYISGSNKTCLLTKMQRPPQWINADYSKVTPDKNILLSFSIDPSSEVTSFSLERKTGLSGLFQQVAQFNDITGSVLYSDVKPDISKIHYYRLSAVNNCNKPIIYSNIASNIVLSMQRSENDINLIWNPYKEWMGSISSYKLYVNTGSSFEERLSIPPGDTSVTFSYADLMYEVSGREVCFLIKAFEASNPYNIDGESQSSQVCTAATETITVPNIFTPDNNLINDFFKPVLSFTPTDYKLIITDLLRRTIFETIDSNTEWDGTNNGNQLPEGVYLWYMNVTTPSGKNISRTGTVTIIFNR
ncbi:MAG: gliding motility-associated C-terminal domain-containing protein [Bacteroidales bacterium]|nr:gliding motility-associated C-terminal domain-containing protein [Bacteroidales bacterium]